MALNKELFNSINAEEDTLKRLDKLKRYSEIEERLYSQPTEVTDRVLRRSSIVNILKKIDTIKKRAYSKYKESMGWTKDNNECSIYSREIFGTTIRTGGSLTMLNALE